MPSFGVVLGFALVCLLGGCARSGLELDSVSETPKQEPADAGQSGAPGLDAGAVSGSLEALCGDYLETMCRFYADCFRESFRDHAQCLEELECYGVENLRSAVAEGRVGYDATRARVCFENLRDDPCRLPVAGTLLNDPFGVDRLLTACPGVIAPQQPEGGECYATGECSYGHRCVYTITCPGHCEKEAGSQEPCHDGGTCYHPQACLDGICRLLAREGEPCESPLDCREDLDCSPNGLCVMVERARLDEPCVMDLNGAKPARLCQDGLFCLIETTLAGTCRPLASAGERCVTDASCLPEHFCSTLHVPGPAVCHPLGDIGGPCNQDGWCKDHLRCAGGPFTDPRLATCSLPRALGEPCQVRDSRSICAEGLICDGYRCVWALHDGDPCDEVLASCVRGDCVDGRCRGLKHLGEPCETFEDCLSRSCRSGRCVDRSVCLEL